MALKKPKAKGGKRVTRADKKKEAAREASRREQESEEDEDEYEDEEGTLVKSPKAPVAPKKIPLVVQNEDKDPDGPSLTVPIPRYNAMLAVLRNTLYM